MKLDEQWSNATNSITNARRNISAKPFIASCVNIQPKLLLACTLLNFKNPSRARASLVERDIKVVLIFNNGLCRLETSQTESVQPVSGWTKWKDVKHMRIQMKRHKGRRRRRRWRQPNRFPFTHIHQFNYLSFGVPFCIHPAKVFDEEVFLLSLCFTMSASTELCGIIIRDTCAQAMIRRKKESKALHGGFEKPERKREKEKKKAFKTRIPVKLQNLSCTNCEPVIMIVHCRNVAVNGVTANATLRH